MSRSAEGRIFTFYSYKGGTGRTMALANIAWILASRGKRVLVIDWDVEAPGLHRYFAPFLSDPTLSETDGLIEFLAGYVVNVTKELPEGTASEAKWYRPYADIKRYAEPLQWQFPDGGGIDLVGAGRQNASYGARVNGFNWDGFYRQFGGGAFLDESIQQMKAAYDYVLIDSRTGISDTSGICTIHMPDALVVFYTLNNQSIEGASSVTAHVTASRQGRSGEPFRVWSMATRVELAEKEKLEARRLFARERFSPFLETLAGLEGQQNEDYWGEMEILYDPFYAYDEILATIADLPGRTNSVLAAFERLSARLTNGQVSRLGEISETKRREALELYSRMGTTKAALNVAQRRQPKAWDIFMSASGSDSKQAERLYYLLGSSYKVFYAPKEIRPGDSWQETITEELEHSRAMLVLFSEESVQRDSKWMSAEMQAARRRLEQDPSFRLIPVQLDPNAIPPVDLLERYQWLSAQGGDMQDIAVQIRRSLGTSAGDESDRDRNARVKAELDQALEEKAGLAARAEQLQQEIKVTQEELKQLSSERAVLIQRAANEEEDRRKAQRRVRMTILSLVIALVAISSTAILAFRQRDAAERALATVADQDRAVPHFAAIMRGHTDTVTGLAFSPDGQRIATASYDRTAKVWDAQSGKELLTLTGHTGSVTGLAFSPDGQRIATASYDRTAKVWDAQSGKELLTLTGHTDTVTGLAFSPDGQRIATASYDRTAKVWDAQSGKELLTLTGHTDRVNGLAFSPDGKRIATASYDRTAKVWDGASGKELLTLTGHTSAVTGLAFSPDGKRIATASFDRTARVWKDIP